MTRWIIYLSQIFTEEQKLFCEQGEHTEKSGPSPVRSPEGKGHNHRDTHVANHQHLTTNNQHLSEGLTPNPSPNGEGIDYRGYPYFAVCVVIRMWTHPDVSLANHQHQTTNTQHPPLVVTFCDICMPEAFCEIETVRKRVCQICEFCERKNSVASLIGLISYRGCVLFLTEKTEEQNTQHSTETLSQPITQNITATFS